VGTPPKDSGEADLSAIDHVARQIATEARSPKLVVEKSTVPALTGVQLQKALAAFPRMAPASFRCASNPEFLREGTAVADSFTPTASLSASRTKKAPPCFAKSIAPFLKKTSTARSTPASAEWHRRQLLITTISSAELIKHASNSFLALKISYANVIADLCERIGADVEEVTRAMGLDPASARSS